jgi:hypothetical protein
VKAWLAALVALLLVAACGEPRTPSPSAPASSPSLSPSRPAPTSTAVPSTTVGPSLGGIACAVTEPRTIDPPASIRGKNGTIIGMASTGELLILQSEIVGVGNRLSLFDPDSRTVTSVVTRKPPESQEAAKSQISGAAADADWVVWQESGFLLEHADWTMWSYERATRKIRQIATFKPGSDGLALPGWASEFSLVGSIAAWSSPTVLDGGRAGQRIFVADLRNGSTKMLSPEAILPSLVSETSLVAAVQTGVDPASRTVLSVPTTISIGNEHLEPATRMEPFRIRSLSAGPAGTVLERHVSGGTAEESRVTAEVVLQDSTGATRTFPLVQDWGSVGAGQTYLAWADQRDLWILPSGSTQPVQVLSNEDDGSTVALSAGPDRLYWRTIGFDVDPWSSSRIAKISC